jgi:hypothetical protein
MTVGIIAKLCEINSRIGLFGKELDNLVTLRWRLSDMRMPFSTNLVSIFRLELRFVPRLGSWLKSITIAGSPSKAASVLLTSDWTGDLVLYCSYVIMVLLCF